MILSTKYAAGDGLALWRRVNQEQRCHLRSMEEKTPVLGVFDPADDVTILSRRKPGVTAPTGKAGTQPPATRFIIFPRPDEVVINLFNLFNLGAVWRAP